MTFVFSTLSESVEVSGSSLSRPFRRDADPFYLSFFLPFFLFRFCHFLAFLSSFLTYLSCTCFSSFQGIQSTLRKVWPFVSPLFNVQTKSFLRNRKIGDKNAFHMKRWHNWDAKDTSWTITNKLTTSSTNKNASLTGL